MTHDDRTDLSVTTRPQPGSAAITRIYCAGIFIGRVCGQAVHDCTGRQRSGDDFARLVLEAVSAGDSLIPADVIDLEPVTGPDGRVCWEMPA
jgi:hypothetical protein